MSVKDIIRSKYAARRLRRGEKDFINSHLPVDDVTKSDAMYIDIQPERDPRLADRTDDEDREVYEAVLDKIWNWWNNTSAKEIARKVRSASVEELKGIVGQTSPKSARRVLSGPKLVEYQFALNRLQKMNESVDLDESFKAGTIELQDGTKQKISSKDAMILNALFDDLNDKNQAAMDAELRKNKEGFADVLQFAKEMM